MAPPACDRCSKRKEKCLFADGAASCRRCIECDARCSFQRRQRRMGRRPVAKALPFGHSQVFSVETPSPTATSAQDGIPPESSPLSSEAAGAVLASWSTPSIPNDDTSLTPGQNSILEPVSDGPSPQEIRHAEVFAMLKDPESFFTFHRRFMIGENFLTAFQSCVCAIAHHSNGALFEAYQAILTLHDLKHFTCQMSLTGHLDWSVGTDCLRVLQNQEALREDDAAAMLLAGQLLFVYHVVAMNTSAHTILSTALLAAKPFYDNMLSQPHLDPITITPILVDTVGSLIRREAPVIRVKSCNREIVDRTAGLCWPLVHLLQDLCETSMHVKQQGNTADTSHSPSSTGSDPYAAIESQIRMWEPNPPASLFTTYNLSEINAMLLQARLYRLASLLIIHRLRHPLGDQDEQAQTWANLIMAELSAYIARTPDGLIGVPIGLPVLAATLETKHMVDTLIPQLANSSAHPRHLAELKRFVNLVWAAREGGFRGLWFDLATSFQMPIVP